MPQSAIPVTNAHQALDILYTFNERNQDRRRASYRGLKVTEEGTLREGSNALLRPWVNARHAREVNKAVRSAAAYLNTCSDGEDLLEREAGSGAIAAYNEGLGRARSGILQTPIRKIAGAATWLQRQCIPDSTRERGTVSPVMDPTARQHIAEVEHLAQHVMHKSARHPKRGDAKHSKLEREGFVPFGTDYARDKKLLGLLDQHVEVMRSFETERAAYRLAESHLNQTAQLQQGKQAIEAALGQALQVEADNYIDCMRDLDLSWVREASQLGVMNQRRAEDIEAFYEQIKELHAADPSVNVYKVIRTHHQAAERILFIACHLASLMSVRYLNHNQIPRYYRERCISDLQAGRNNKLFDLEDDADDALHVRALRGIWSKTLHYCAQTTGPNTFANDEIREQAGYTLALAQLSKVFEDGFGSKTYRRFDFGNSPSQRVLTELVIQLCDWFAALANHLGLDDVPEYDRDPGECADHWNDFEGIFGLYEELDEVILGLASQSNLQDRLEEDAQTLALSLFERLRLLCGGQGYTMGSLLSDVRLRNPNARIFRPLNESPELEEQREALGRHARHHIHRIPGSETRHFRWLGFMWQVLARNYTTDFNRAPNLDHPSLWLKGSAD